MIRPCLTSSEVNPFSFLACLAAVGSFAPSATSAAAHHEEHRINRGISKGLITPTEADYLIDLLIDAYDLETECVADGYLTPEEEGDLYWSERALNRAIRWEMRDFDVW